MCQRCLNLEKSIIPCATHVHRSASQVDAWLGEELAWLCTRFLNVLPRCVACFELLMVMVCKGLATWRWCGDVAVLGVGVTCRACAATVVVVGARHLM